MGAYTRTPSKNQKKANNASSLKQPLSCSEIKFSNNMLRSPLLFTLTERRFLYKLASFIELNRKELKLNDRESWDNLEFRLKKKELADIGSGHNIENTLKVIRSLAGRKFTQYYTDTKNKRSIGEFCWIESIDFDPSTREYVIRVSPDLYEYTKKQKGNYSSFNLNVGIQLKSIYSQKLYEICSSFTSGKQRFRFIDKRNPDFLYKERVVSYSYNEFQFMLGINDYRDPKTGKIYGNRGESGKISKYPNFSLIEERILLPAQAELYELYKNGDSHVWFDYSTERSGRGQGGGRVDNVILYFYTKEHPKSMDPVMDRPWQKGDEMLSPYDNGESSYVSQVTPSSTTTVAKPSVSAPCQIEDKVSIPVESKSRVYVDSKPVMTNKTAVNNNSTYDERPIDVFEFIAFFNCSVKYYNANISTVELDDPRKQLDRQKALNKLLKYGYTRKDLRLAMEKMIYSDYINGRGNCRKSAGKLRFGIDFLLDRRNLQKLLEGNFDNYTPKQFRIAR